MESFYTEKVFKNNPFLSCFSTPNYCNPNILLNYKISFSM